MKLSNEMLEYKPYLLENSILYLRKEKNSTYTIRFVSNKLEQIVNESFISLLNFFDGNNSVRNIIEIFSKSYPNVPQKVFEDDISNVIITLSDLQLLRSDEENPFLPKLKVQINEFQELYLANYTDFSEIKLFLEHTKNKENKFNYMEYYNPLRIETEYDSANLIANAIRNKEYIFILKENNEIKSILNFNQEKSILVSLEYMKIEKKLKNIGEIINFALTTILKITKDDLNIFRINLLKSENRELVSILKDIGFEQLCLLKNELGNSIDIEEYNYYV